MAAPRTRTNDRCATSRATRRARVRRHACRVASAFVLVTFVSTFIFLAGPRAFQTYQATGELPEIPDALRKWL